MLTGHAVVVDGERIARRRRRADAPTEPAASTCRAHAAPRAHGPALAPGRRGGERAGVRALVMRSSAQEALFGVRNARRIVEAGFTTVRDVGSFRAFIDVALRERSRPVGSRAPHAVRRRLRDLPGRRRRPHGPRARRRRGRAARAAVRRHERRRRDARDRAPDPPLRRRLHQGHRDGRGAHERHEPGRAGVHRGRAPRRGRGGRRAPAPSSRRTRTAPRASSARCAPACARSSTAR